MRNSLVAIFLPKAGELVGASVEKTKVLTGELEVQSITSKSARNV